MTEQVAFIGVGNMGNPMANNLVKAGKKVKVFDVSKNMIEKAKEKKLDIVENLDDLITNEVTTVITMLPEGKNSKDVYVGDKGIINKVSKNCLLIDCSTIDIQTSIEIGTKARYEQATMEHHDHLIDVNTGEIIEFVNNDIEKLQKKVAEELGYKLVDHRLELYGTKNKK